MKRAFTHALTYVHTNNSFESADFLTDFLMKVNGLSTAPDNKYFRPAYAQDPAPYGKFICNTPTSLTSTLDTLTEAQRTFFINTDEGTAYNVIVSIVTTHKKIKEDTEDRIAFGKYSKTTPTGFDKIKMVVEREMLKVGVKAAATVAKTNNLNGAQDNAFTLFFNITDDFDTAMMQSVRTIRVDDYTVVNIKWNEPWATRHGLCKNCGGRAEEKKPNVVLPPPPPANQRGSQYDEYYDRHVPYVAPSVSRIPACICKVTDGKQTVTGVEIEQKKRCREGFHARQQRRKSTNPFAGSSTDA